MDVTCIMVRNRARNRGFPLLGFQSLASPLPKEESLLSRVNLSIKSSRLPIPSVIEDTLPKASIHISIILLLNTFLKQSGKASLGVDTHRAIAAESIPVEEVLLSLNMEAEHSVLDMVNRLEGAIFAWKQKISDQIMKKSPIRYLWSLVKENGSQVEKMAGSLFREG
ncbi:unnamed protein product [Musa hybrid cultivar]